MVFEKITNLSGKDLISNPGWKRSYLEGFSQDEFGNAVPWMTYPAIDFLQKNLTKNHEIFEFGCGASTLFFAARVHKVVSLETNPRWAEIIRLKLLQLQLNNVKITLMKDGLTNPLYENFPKNSGKKFDLIVIDSLKRFPCAQNVIDALKPGGSILLDDSERKNYRKIFEFFAEKNFEQKDFPGIAPGQFRPKNTSFFTKKF